MLLACDSRPSSPALLAAAAAGVQALGGVAVDCGLLTTPQLHWQLRRLNQGLPWALEDYFTTMAGAYEQLVAGTQPLGQVSLTSPCIGHVVALQSSMLIPVCEVLCCTVCECASSGQSCSLSARGTSYLELCELQHWHASSNILKPFISMSV